MLVRDLIAALNQYGGDIDVTVVGQDNVAHEIGEITFDDEALEVVIQIDPA